MMTTVETTFTGEDDEQVTGNGNLPSMSTDEYCTQAEQGEEK